MGWFTNKKGGEPPKYAESSRYKVFTFDDFLPKKSEKKLEIASGMSIFDAILPTDWVFCLRKRVISQGWYSLPKVFWVCGVAYSYTGIRYIVYLTGEIREPIDVEGRFPAKELNCKRVEHVLKRVVRKEDVVLSVAEYENYLPTRQYGG